MGWNWKLADADGKAVTPDEAMPEFTSQSDAESWLGEVWRDLVSAGDSRPQSYLVLPFPPGTLVLPDRDGLAQDAHLVPSVGDRQGDRVGAGRRVGLRGRRRRARSRAVSEVPRVAELVTVGVNRASA